MFGRLALKLTISTGAVAVIVLHAAKPDLRIDSITLGLIVVGILPRLTSVIESA